MSRYQQETTLVAVEREGMRTLDWHERLEGDPKVLAIGEAERDGEIWVYAECRSARACTALVAQFSRCGVLSASRKGPAQLWLERADEQD